MALLRRLTNYLERRYDFSGLLLTHLEEGRRRPQIPLVDVFRCVFLLFAHRFKSLNALEEVLRRRGRPMVQGRAPSADTIGYAYARMKSDGPRAVLKGVCTRVRRNKALRHRDFWAPWTAAVDGHELFKSFSRCCDDCRVREVKVKEHGEEVVKTQYYHTVVVAQLVGVEPPICLDAEMVRPGEGEVTAARRLVARLIENYPFIRIFTLDGLYLEAPILKLILDTGRAAIVTLKQENRDLYQNVQGLFRSTPPHEVAREGGERLQYWDFSGLDSWEGLEGETVRVVRTIRTRRVRHRVKREWVVQEEIQDWTWAVFGLGPEVTALAIHRLGRGRWDIENCAFNEEDREFGLDHCFKHDPTAILNFILTLFVATVLTELFFTRNVKLPVGGAMSLAGWARILLEHPPLRDEPIIWAQARAP